MLRHTVSAAFALLLASAAGAGAADLAVSVTGRTPAQIKGDVMVAADKVCTEAMRKNELEDSSEEQCVIDTVAATMKQIAQKAGDMTIAAADAPH